MSDALLDLFIPGKPQPGGSKKAFRNPHTGKIIVTDDAKHGAGWREVVAGEAKRAWGGKPLLEVPLRLVVTFCLLRPKGHFGSGNNCDRVKESAPDYPAIRPDVLKYTRSTEDALTGIIWRDDALIVEEFVRKVYASKPGARVMVFAMPKLKVKQVTMQPGLF